MILPSDASPDQSNCPPDYYRRNNGMLHQIAESGPQSPVNELGAATIEKLGGMSKEELIALVRRCAWPQWAIGMLTKAEIAEAMMHRLAEKALDPAGRETLQAIQQWLDREKGKAVTPIAAQIQVTEVRPIDKRELARKLDFLMSMAKEGTESPLIEG